MKKPTSTKSPAGRIDAETQAEFMRDMLGDPPKSTKKPNRIALLEKRLVDVEKRHAEAIARLSLSVELLLHAPETGTESIEDQVTKAHMRVNELVEKDWDRVFAEWEHDTGAWTSPADEATS